MWTAHISNLSLDHASASDPDCWGLTQTNRLDLLHSHHTPPPAPATRTSRGPFPRSGNGGLTRQTWFGYYIPLQTLAPAHPGSGILSVFWTALPSQGPPRAPPACVRARGRTDGKDCGKSRSKQVVGSSRWSCTSMAILLSSWDSAALSGPSCSDGAQRLIGSSMYYTCT